MKKIDWKKHLTPKYLILYAAILTVIALAIILVTLIGAKSSTVEPTIDNSIASIVTERVDGGTRLIIHYTDPNLADTVVFIPDGQTGATGEKGDKGDQGDKGEQGEPGRGVLDIQQIGDLWIITYTDEPDLPMIFGPYMTDENALKYVTISAEESEAYAVAELSKYLKKKNVYTSKQGGFPITLSVDSSLGEDAFTINATLSGEDIGMVIAGGSTRGVLYGVYKFLEQYADFRFFTAELETYTEDPVILKEGELLSYTPFFEYRSTSWHCIYADPAWSIKNGLNANGSLTPEMGGYVNYGGYFVHTLGKLSETGSTASKNPCLTSEKTYQTVLKNLRAVLAKDPTINIISVSQNDNNNYCTCESCAASDKKYSTNPYDATKGGPAGTMLAFVNRIAEELEDEYPDLVIDTLAYNYTQAAPKGIVPRENVCIRVCSIRVCFMHPMEECPEYRGPNDVQWTRTKLFLQDFKDWGKICDRIYVWDYTTNFRYYIAPFSNFGAIRENMQFYHENGARGMFAQGNGQSVSGEFGELRAYLLAKLMWNPYMTEEEYYAHMDEFLQAYYGEGWTYIRKYIDTTTELAKDGCINIYEEPLQSITEAEYLAYENDFDNWWDQAEALAGDRLEYVKRSRLQWRCIKILLHPDDEAALAFAADVAAYGVKWAESAGNNKPVYQMDPFKHLYPNLQP